MGFQKLQKIDTGTPGTAPVTMRLTKRATVVVQVKKSFFDEFDEVLWERADLFIGNDFDKGKLRIEPARDGLIKVTQLKHGLNISVGRLPGIGPGPSESHAAIATLVNDAIELTIPELPVLHEDAPDHADEVEEDAEDDAPDGGADEDATITVPLPPIPAPKGEAFGGVTIDLAEGRETVTNRGVTAEVTKRQAKLVYLLAKNRAAGSTRAFIRSALWDGNPPTEADQVLTQIVTDIADVLAPLKLAVVPKGVGFKLVDL